MSPLGAATANLAHASVTREDLEQAGKPSTGQAQTVHRPMTRSQGKIRPRSDTPVSVDRPSCTVRSDIMDELRTDEEIVV